MIRNRGYKSSVTGPGFQRLDRVIQGSIRMDGTLSNEIPRPICRYAQKIRWRRRCRLSGLGGNVLRGWTQLAQEGDEVQRATVLKGGDTLFVSLSEKKSLTAILEAVKGSGVLTVADTEGFLDAGGMINLLLDPDRKICFEINLDATRQSGWEVSLKLLRLAKRVVDQGKGAGAKR